MRRLFPFQSGYHRALAGGEDPVEVHLTDVFQREESRRRLLFSDLAAEVITGKGPEGYRLALQTLHRLLGEE
jgi:3-dehydroquinate dehydratase-2